MQINVADAKAHFADLIRRAEAGEEIELTRYGRPVARLVAPAPVGQGALVGCLKGRFTLPSDAEDAEMDAEIAAAFGA
ncbi:type II toxin-antitoxin system Phd/YefM family antitoxin [Jannaschia rubra]|uniref:Antitoxin n=2 Tax=Jannaschia rubra TaxID=282197 RepID=A0A0M6XTS8_9RHOB|nr:type II toxin-antitoxin system prevent-host-death family antitoxin [Jannaschia rubra]CTQ34566.1 prevent-host-death family protein [Jannaschia rubra]SFG71426.1 prevent-host-death family protein [Jannaschia rubra]